VNKGDEDQKPTKDAAFQRVVRYFLGHSKPKDEAKPRPSDKPPTKKRSTKAIKRA
jgi:hypothetical protein